MFSYFVVFLNFHYDYVDFDNHIKMCYSVSLNDLVYFAIDLNMNFLPDMIYWADKNIYYESD